MDCTNEKKRPGDNPAATAAPREPTNNVNKGGHTTFIHEFLAGQVGGVAGILAVYPLDTAKIRLQTSLKYTSTYDVLSSMIRDDGIRYN